MAGGSLVVAFALVSQGLTPKRYAGLFSAAPAVALASLTITVIDKGSHDAHHSATGMIAGAVGMVAYAAVVVRLLRHVRASRAAVAGMGAWAAVAAVVAVPLLLA